MSKTQQAADLDPVAAGTEGHATSAPEPKGWSKYFVSRTKLIQIWTGWLAALLLASALPWFFAEFDGPHVMRGVYSSAPLKRRESARFRTEIGLIELRCNVSFYPLPVRSCQHGRVFDQEISIEYVRYTFLGIESIIGIRGYHKDKLIFEDKNLKKSMLIRTIIYLSIIFAVFAFYASTKRDQ
jgi:hypothetical protein